MDLIKKPPVSYINGISSLMAKDEDTCGDIIKMYPKETIYATLEYVQYFSLNCANSNIDKIAKEIFGDKYPQYEDYFKLDAEKNLVQLFEKEFDDNKTKSLELSAVGFKLFIKAKEYEDGISREKNLKKAIEYYKMAVSAGSIEACEALANYFESVGNIAMAMKYLKEAIELLNYQPYGNAGAYYVPLYNAGAYYAPLYIQLASLYLRLGMHYYSSDPDNLANYTAKEYLQKAADLGRGEAYEILSYMYLKGIGCVKDTKKAFECIVKWHLYSGNESAKIALKSIGNIIPKK